MPHHQLTKDTIDDVQGDLTRLGAKCRIATKAVPRGRWTTVHEGIETVEAALTLVNDLVDTAEEVAIFLEHDYYGGIFVWTSLEPDIANRFDNYAL